MSSGIDGPVVRPLDVGIKANPAAPAATQPPQAKPILLGFKKITDLNGIDPAKLPKSLQVGLIAVNTQGSRLTHVTINVAEKPYKVEAGDLAKLLNVSRIEIIFKAIFGGLNALIDSKFNYKENRIEVMRDLAAKNKMRPLAEELLKWQFDKQEFGKACNSIANLSLSPAQKEVLLESMLRRIPSEKEKIAFLLDKKTQLEAAFGTTTYSKVFEIYQKSYFEFYQKAHVESFATLWEQGNHKGALIFFNKIPINARFKLNEQIAKKLGPAETLNFAKFIVTSETSRCQTKKEADQFFRESKLSDAFHGYFLTDHLGPPLKNDAKFKDLLNKKNSPERNKLIFEHLAVAAKDFPKDLKEYCQHLCNEANKLGVKESAGLDFLAKSLLLKSAFTIFTDPAFKMTTKIAGEKANELMHYAQNVNEPGVMSFLMAIGGTGRELVGKELTPEQMLRGKQNAEVAEFYEAILTVTLNETAESLIEAIFDELNSLPPEAKKLKLEALEIQRRDLKYDESKLPVIENIRNKILMHN